MVDEVHILLHQRCGRDRPLRCHTCGQDDDHKQWVTIVIIALPLTKSIDFHTVGGSIGMVWHGMAWHAFFLLFWSRAKTFNLVSYSLSLSLSLSLCQKCWHICTLMWWLCFNSYCTTVCTSTKMFESIKLSSHFFKMIWFWPSCYARSRTLDLSNL